MFSSRWLHSAHSKTDRHSEKCLQDTPFQGLDDFSSSTHYLASNIPQINKAHLFPSLLSWFWDVYKSSSNHQLNCEVTRKTYVYWWQQMTQKLNRWLPQHYTITDSELLTVDKLHKFTKLINFIIISADYWVSYSSGFQNTWSQQQTLSGNSHFTEHMDLIQFNTGKTT